MIYLFPLPFAFQASVSFMKKQHPDWITLDLPFIPDGLHDTFCQCGLITAMLLPFYLLKMICSKFFLQSGKPSVKRPINVMPRVAKPVNVMPNVSEGLTRIFTIINNNPLTSKTTFSEYVVLGSNTTIVKSTDVPKILRDIPNGAKVVEVSYSAPQVMDVITPTVSKAISNKSTVSTPITTPITTNVTSTVPKLINKRYSAPIPTNGTHTLPKTIYTTFSVPKAFNFTSTRSKVINNKRTVSAPLATVSVPKTSNTTSSVTNATPTVPKVISNKANLPTPTTDTSTISKASVGILIIPSTTTSQITCANELKTKPTSTITTTTNEINIENITLFGKKEMLKPASDWTSFQETFQQKSTAKPLIAKDEDVKNVSPPSVKKNVAARKIAVGKRTLSAPKAVAAISNIGNDCETQPIIDITPTASKASIFIPIVASTINSQITCVNESQPATTTTASTNENDMENLTLSGEEDMLKPASDCALFQEKFQQKNTVQPLIVKDEDVKKDSPPGVSKFADGKIAVGKITGTQKAVATISHIDNDRKTQPSDVDLLNKPQDLSRPLFNPVSTLPQKECVASALFQDILKESLPQQQQHTKDASSTTTDYSHQTATSIIIKPSQYVSRKIVEPSDEDFEWPIQLSPQKNEGLNRALAEESGLSESPDWSAETSSQEDVLELDEDFNRDNCSPLKPTQSVARVLSENLAINQQNAKEITKSTEDISCTTDAGEGSDWSLKPVPLQEMDSNCGTMIDVKNMAEKVDSSKLDGGSESDPDLFRIIVEGSKESMPWASEVLTGQVLNGTSSTTKSKPKQTIIIDPPKIDQDLLDVILEESDESDEDWANEPQTANEGLGKTLAEEFGVSEGSDWSVKISSQGDVLDSDEDCNWATDASPKANSSFIKSLAEDSDEGSDWSMDSVPQKPFMRRKSSGIEVTILEEELCGLRLVTEPTDQGKDILAKYGLDVPSERDRYWNFMYDYLTQKSPQH
eukprot:Ihof_evm1s131 gene=Ihof_evmTU1s131